MMGMINPSMFHQMNNPRSYSGMNPMMGMIGRANPFSANNSMGMGMNPMMGMIGRGNPYNMNNPIEKPIPIAIILLSNESNLLILKLIFFKFVFCL